VPHAAQLVGSLLAEADRSRVADWLEELAVYGNAGRICDEEIAHQLSLAVENLYLVDLAINPKRKSFDLTGSMSAIACY
jgi:hypothetical protein